MIRIFLCCLIGLAALAAVGWVVTGIVGRLTGREPRRGGDQR